MLNKFKNWLLGVDDKHPGIQWSNINKRKAEYYEYPVRQPTECNGHERVWTAAKGIWYCYDCKQHYRTWADER